MISEPLSQISDEHTRVEQEQFSFHARLAFCVSALVIAGWIWPYEVTNLPSYISGAGWVLGWFTVLVLAGAATGYLLRTRWSILVAPLALYVGGVIHWFHLEWGFNSPPWTLFLLVSGLALGVLFITAGTAAGIAARVVQVEAALAPPSDGIRRSAAVVALLGLFAITTVQVLPTPFVGALLGLGALLAGAGLMEEERVNRRELLLAIVGMTVGVVAIGTQLFSLWALIKNF